MRDLKFNVDSFERKILAVCQTETFRSLDGIIGEVPFFIADFPVENTVDVNGVIRRLEKQLEHTNINILSLSLYDLMIEIITDHNLFESIVSNEHEVSEGELRELLNNETDPELHLVEYISQKIKRSNCKIMFIKDMGMLHPYFRLHTLLNSLQSVADNFPSIFFFPGKYKQTKNGSHLRLFDRLNNENYYRAYNILERVDGE